MKPTEHEIQSAFISWCEFPPTLRAFPELEMIFAIPNGANKSIATAMKFKREGLRSGVPDVCLPVPIGKFHGLYLEFKRDHKQKLSPNQIEWAGKLERYGYKVRTVSDALTAEDIVKKYLRGEST